MSAATITKAEIATHLFRELVLSKKAAKEIVDALFAEISTTLANGLEVQLINFGNFKLRDKKERVGRNPKTKEVAPIKARRVVTFRIAQALKDKLQTV